MNEENKMTVGKLKELLEKYNANDQVILSIRFYMERKRLKLTNSRVHMTVGIFCT